MSLKRITARLKRKITSMLMCLGLIYYPVDRFITQIVLVKHKEVCLKINGKQSVKLKSESIKFNNRSKQIAVPFKIYPDFESVLKELKRINKDSNTSYTKKYQEHIPCSFAYKVVCIDDKLAKKWSQ